MIGVICSNIIHKCACLLIIKILLSQFLPIGQQDNTFLSHLFEGSARLCKLSSI